MFLRESIDEEISESNIANPGTNDKKANASNSRQDFIKRSRFILSFSDLISKQLIAILLMMLFGITLLIIALIMDVCFISVVLRV